VIDWFRGHRQLSYVGAAIVALLVVFLLREIRQSPSTAAPEQASGDCVDLIVNSSVEKDDLVRDLANRYNGAGRVFDNRCATVQVYATASGTAMASLAAGWQPAPDGAPAPHVWTPTSSLWRELLQQRAAGGDGVNVVPAGEFASITQSRMTIAMPRPMAEALGWPDSDISWQDIYELATDQDGWASRGHPEWGRFALGRDNPHVSTSGLAATVATFYAATGLSSDLTEADIENPEVTTFVHGVESSVLHYGDTALTFLDNLAKADARGEALSYVSAIVMQEQLAYLYNKGNPLGRMAVPSDARTPTVQLVAVQPTDGAFELDHPYFVLDSATDDQKAAAADFLAFLLEDDQQRRFTEFGFRDHEGNPSDELVASVGIDRDQNVPVLAPPSGAVLDKAMQGWDALRKKARVLLVIDVSGSMDDGTGAGQSKLEAAKAAALRALDLLSPDDQVGLWAFSGSNRDGRDPITRLVAPSRLGDGMGRLTEAINGLAPSGATALYHTARAAQRDLAAGFDPALINAAVLLTDGKNDYNADADLERLITDLDSAGRNNPVRIFTIAYGVEADFAALERIATATRAANYDARDPTSIDKVLVSVLSNF